jgi:ribonuclease-3
MKKFVQQFARPFKDISFLKMALTHRSYGEKNNERLEFLGDSLLNFCIAEKLFHEHPDYQEGTLTRMRANLVNAEVLAALAKKLEVHKYIKMGAGELYSGGADRKSTLADAMEAIIAAIYLDGGAEACKRQIAIWFSDSFVKATSRGIQKDPKTQLQEYMQAKKMNLPVYHILSETGDAHTRLFRVTCHISTWPHPIEGTGSSRKRAEQDCAEKLLALLGIKNSQ